MAVAGEVVACGRGVISDNLYSRQGIFCGVKGRGGRKAEREMLLRRFCKDAPSNLSTKRLPAIRTRP